MSNPGDSEIPAPKPLGEIIYEAFHRHDATYCCSQVDAYSLQLGSSRSMVFTALKNANGDQLLLAYQRPFGLVHGVVTAGPPELVTIIVSQTRGIISQSAQKFQSDGRLGGGATYTRVIAGEGEIPDLNGSIPHGLLRSIPTRTASQVEFDERMVGVAGDTRESEHIQLLQDFFASETVPDSGYALLLRQYIERNKGVVLPREMAEDMGDWWYWLEIVDYFNAPQPRGLLVSGS